MRSSIITVTGSDIDELKKSHDDHFNWAKKRKMFPHLFEELANSLNAVNECMKYEDYLTYYVIRNEEEGYRVRYHRTIKGQSCGSGPLGNDPLVHTQGLMEQKFSCEQEAEDFATMMTETSKKNSNDR